MRVTRGSPKTRLHDNATGWFCPRNRERRWVARSVAGNDVSSVTLQRWEDDGIWSSPRTSQGSEALTLRVGISTPWDLWQLSPDAQRQRLGSVADAGIDHVFTADHVSFVDGSGIDGLIHLAAMSGLEPRLDLHVGVMLLALRHPMIAARQIASLAEAAPGRITVGIGVGGEDRHEIEVCDVDPRTRGRRTDVALGMVGSLLAGETVHGDGEFFSFIDGVIRPTPEPRVPLLVGGRSDAAVHRAGRLADGWLGAWCSPRRFAAATTLAEDTGAERGVTWQHGLQLWVGVGPTPEVARRHVSATMQDFYKTSFEPFERYTAMGSAEHIAEFLAPYVDAGAAMLNLVPCGPDRDTEIETIAEVKRLLDAAPDTRSSHTTSLTHKQKGYS